MHPYHCSTARRGTALGASKMGGALLAGRRQLGRTPSLCIWCVVGTSQSISCIGVAAFQKAGQTIRICSLRPRCCKRTREDRAGRSSLVATRSPAIAGAWTKIPVSDALLRTDAIWRQWKRSGHRVHSAGARAVRLATKHDTPRSSLSIRSGPYSGPRVARRILELEPLASGKASPDPGAPRGLELAQLQLQRRLTYNGASEDYRVQSRVPD